jgi:integrase
MQTHPTKARRVKVAKRPGVYYRLDRDGDRRYEIDFYDENGDRRWKVVDGDLEAAEDLRNEMRRRRRSGEIVRDPKATFSEVADRWLASQTHLRPRTIEVYTWALEKHLRPRFGRRSIAKIREEDVLQLIAAMQAADLAAWTIRAVLTPFGRIMGYAVRHYRLGSNPLRRLERGERPSAVTRNERRVLTSDEIAKLLGKATPRYRPVLATAVFTGLRLGELLGLIWADVDFDEGLVRVRKQLDRAGDRVEPKTPKALRDVVLMPALGTLLREHKLSSPPELTGAGCPVFATRTGKPLYYRNVSHALDKAIERAELDGEGKGRVTMHSLRHGFASHLILDLKLDPVKVSRQLGHARPSITEDTYAHEFEVARHADEIREAMASSEFGTILERSGAREQSPPADKLGEIVPIRAVSGPTRE